MTMRARLAAPVEEVVGDINLFLRGWAGYFRYGNSAHSFDEIRSYALMRLVLFVGKRHQLGAVNFLIRGLLGTGATSTLRLDAQAKALGEWLRSRSTKVPQSLDVNARRIQVLEAAELGQGEQYQSWPRSCIADSSRPQVAHRGAQILAAPAARSASRRSPTTRGAGERPLASTDTSPANVVAKRRRLARSAT